MGKSTDRTGTTKKAGLSSTQRRKLISSAFLMMTSAIGPAFLTQTALFTEQLGASFGFIILVSVIISIGAQLNIWRILTIANSYAQSVSNQVFPGLGYVISFFIVLGGLAFNIGNIAGAGLGMSAIFGIDVRLGGVIIGLFSILIFLSRNGQTIVDYVVQVLGTIMLGLCLYVAIISDPPLGEVALRTVVPESSVSIFMPIITIVGGTVGGYITFSGAHRLIESGLVGKKNLPFVSYSAVSGVLATGLMRIFLFLAVLGVIVSGGVLDLDNPAASAFEISLGQTGLIIFGLILLAAALSSVIGAAYTSTSFMRSFHPFFDKHNKYVIVTFIAISSIIYTFVGQPVTLLVLAGAFNGLILPLTLGTTLIASTRKEIVGDYKHPKWLIIYGVIAVMVTLIIGVMSLGNLAQLWNG